jgi:cell division septation protein DedD
MENEKQPSKKSEFLMIAAVVILAFGLTVTGVVYLAKYLIGAPPAARPPVMPKADEEVVIRYSIEPDNNSAVIITDSDIPAEGDNRTASTLPGTFRPFEITPSPSNETPAAPPASEAVESSAAPIKTPETAEPKTVQPKMPDAVSGKYQLQLFALSNKQTADREAARLKGEYPDIYVVQAEVQGKTWYRVRCCRTDSRNEAAKIRDEITVKHKEIRPDIITN